MQAWQAAEHEMTECWSLSQCYLQNSVARKMCHISELVQI